MSYLSIPLQLFGFSSLLATKVFVTNGVPGHEAVKFGSWVQNAFPENQLFLSQGKRYLEGHLMMEAVSPFIASYQIKWRQTPQKGNAYTDVSRPTSDFPLPHFLHTLTSHMNQ